MPLDGAEFKLSEIMQFITGSPTITPIGITAISLKFKHDCDTGCRCLPRANTCSAILTLPVHTNDLPNMQERFGYALASTKKYGFGMS